MAKIGVPKGSGKLLKVREKSVKSQGILKWILSGNPVNVKMPTTVGILTFISMVNTTTERLKARNFFICWYFSFYEQLKFHAQSLKKFYNVGACAVVENSHPTYT